MKYLITGGCGFLGSNLAADVLRRDEELVVFDNLARLGASENLAWLKKLGKLIFHHGDVRSERDIDHAVAEHRPDVIFHVAGQVAMTTSLERPALDFQVNALGSFNLLESVRRHAPRATVIYSSTNKVYGDLEQFTYRETSTRYECVEKPHGFDESTPLDFRSPYGCSKGAADQYFLDYARVFGLNTVVFRHSSMYGGRQFATYDQGWVGWFCDQARRAKSRQLANPFTICGNGKQVRDVLHVEDVCALYVAAAAKIDRARGQAFNIGGGSKQSLSLLELFGLLEDELEVRLRYDQLPPRPSDQKVFVANIAKARELLNWEPRVSSREGVRRMLAGLEE